MVDESQWKTEKEREYTAADSFWKRMKWQHWAPAPTQQPNASLRYIYYTTLYRIFARHSRMGRNARCCIYSNIEILYVFSILFSHDGCDSSPAACTYNTIRYVTSLWGNKREIKLLHIKSIFLPHRTYVYVYEHELWNIFIQFFASTPSELCIVYRPSPPPSAQPKNLILQSSAVHCLSSWSWLRKW